MGGMAAGGKAAVNTMKHDKLAARRARQESRRLERIERLRRVAP